MYWATLGGTLLATDATVEATVAGNILGWAPAGASTCNNPLGLGAASGSLVLVVERESNGDLDIIAVKSSGGGCTFTLTSAYSAGAASATVDTPWGAAPDAAAAAITVNDPQGLFARALTAAIGEALYDPTQGYIVVACNQETTMYAGTLGANLTASTTSVNVQSLAACDAKPFGQATTSSYYPAYNTLKLSGKSGDPCYIKWNQTTARWEITAVKGSSVGGCEFTLTSAFSAGSASATVTTVWGTTPDAVGASITVVDLGQLYGPCVASGGNYSKGVAVYDPIGGQYVVVKCQTKCRLIYGYTNAALTAGGSVSCTVNGGQDGMMPVTAGLTLTVYCNDGTFGSALYANFLASYDPGTDKYYFIWVSC
jgi:hypothetical protein